MESNRVCGVNPFESNFHIFYELLEHASPQILAEIRLESCINYKVSISTRFISDLTITFFCSYIYAWLQYLPDRNFTIKSFNASTNFDFINNNLDHLGIRENDKTSIYFILSAILNLGNIQFESDDINNDRCFVTNESHKFLSNAAFCLKVDETELEDALISRSREMAKQVIK